MVLTASNIDIRDFCGSDLEAVLKIERSVQVNPWSRLSFEQSLTQKHLCRVVEHEQQILAFHIVSPVLDELHILNLAVALDQQGVGLGHVLIDDILEQAKIAKTAKIFLEVRETNVAAQGLYLKWQFRQIAVRKNYYRCTDGGRENALVMVRKLTSSD